MNILQSLQIVKNGKLRALGVTTRTQAVLAVGEMTKHGGLANFRATGR